MIHTCMGNQSTTQSNSIEITGHTNAGASHVLWVYVWCRKTILIIIFFFCLAVYCLLTWKDKVISGSKDKTIRLWDVPTYTQEGILKGHDDCVCYIVLFRNRLVRYASSTPSPTHTYAPRTHTNHTTHTTRHG